MHTLKQNAPSTIGTPLSPRTMHYGRLNRRWSAADGRTTSSRETPANTKPLQLSSWPQNQLGYETKHAANTVSDQTWSSRVSDVVTTCSRATCPLHYDDGTAAPAEATSWQPTCYDRSAHTAQSSPCLHCIGACCTPCDGLLSANCVHTRSRAIKCSWV